MSTHTTIGSMQYAAGDWFVVAKENGFVLLPGHVAVATLERVWAALGSGRIAAVIDAMTATAGAPLSAVPPFAIVIGHRGDLRVAVRGDVRVVYDDGSRQELITGGRMETWVEQELPAHVALLVTPPESQIDETLLPLVSGIARTGLVAVGTQERSAPAPANTTSVGAVADAAAIDAPGVGRGEHAAPDRRVEAVVEEGVDREPASTADSHSDSGSDVVPGTESHSDPAPASGSDSGLDLRPDSSSDVVSGAESYSDPAPASGSGLRSASSSDVAPEPEPDIKPASEPESGDPATSSLAAAEDPVSADLPEASGTAAAPEASDAPSGRHDMAMDELVGDHDGHTVEQSFLDAARAAGMVPDTDPDAALPTGVDDASDFFAEFGIDLDGRAAGDAAHHGGGHAHGDGHAHGGRVVLSTGVVLELDRPLIVGRRPRIEQGTSDDIPELITVASPTHDISRNHLEIRRDGEAMTVTDLNTTNGTMLLREGDGPLRLHPGEPTMVLSGDVLDIGDEVTLRFEDIP